MPGIRIKKKSSQNALAHSRNHSARKSKHSTKRNNKKHKASRKNKILHGGSEHLNEPSNAMIKRMEKRKKQLLLQTQPPPQPQPQQQLQAPVLVNAQQPFASTSSRVASSNIITKLQSVLERQ